MTNSPATPSSRPRTAPVPVRVAAGLLALNAVAWGAMGVFEASQVRADRLEVGVGAALLMLLYAGALALVVRGLLRVRPWSRGPAVASQVVQLPVAYSFLAGPTVAVGVAMGVVGLVVLGCLLSPPATRALVPGA